MGIQTPERNALLKAFLQAHGRPESEQSLEQVVKLLWAQPEREFQNVAMSFLDTRGKRTVESRIMLLESLIMEKSWWDTVDFLAGNAVGSYLTHYPSRSQLTRIVGFNRITYGFAARRFSSSLVRTNGPTRSSISVHPRMCTREGIFYRQSDWMGTSSIREDKSRCSSCVCSERIASTA